MANPLTELRELIIVNRRKSGTLISRNNGIAVVRTKEGLVRASISAEIRAAKNSRVYIEGGTVVGSATLVKNVKTYQV